MARPPSVDAVIGALADLDSPRRLVADIARTTIDEARGRMLAGEEVDVLAEARRALEAAIRDRPRQLINCTGVLLHTNLGRAPLHPRAAEAASEAAMGYTNLEFDINTGTRGDRGAYTRRLLMSITGGESALVVNNNAGGLFLALAVLARDRSVPVSRGELIEIGGSYRLPELMAATGARMTEVGTTNRTRISDYERACSDDTALLLKVHPSNYRVVGFSEEALLAELVQLGRDRRVPVVFDLGSGLLDEEVTWLPGPPPPWLQGEPGVRQSLETGADLVLFSGDKLLGGPQAGILVGKRSLVDVLASHPIARALRADGPTLAALTATLELYADGAGAEIPLWAMATTPSSELAQRAAKASAGLPAEIIEGQSLLGAGSVPGRGIPTPVLSIDPPDPGGAWLALLRAGVVARREAGRILVDLRAVPAGEDGRVHEALVAACRS